MPILEKARCFAAKVEAAIGTAESLTTSEAAYNVYNLRISPEIDFDQRQGQGGFGRLSSTPGPRIGVATFLTDCAYDGTNIPSWASVLLPGCGVVASSTTFRPRTEAPGSNVKTLTIGGYTGGKFKSIYGAMGTFRFVCSAGRKINIEWTFRGIYADETDTALITPTYPTTLTALRFGGGATSWNSTNICLQGLTFDIGNVLTPVFCSTPSAGFSNFCVTDRNPMVTGDPEMVLVATQDRWTQHWGQTEATLSFTLDGPSNSTIAISAPKAQIVRMAESARSGISTDQLTWQCNRNGTTADQEFSIVFTHAS